MKKYIIAGGSGLIGKKLSDILSAKGDEVIILTTNKEKKSKHKNIKFVYWDTITKHIEYSFDKETSYHIINLAGTGVAEKRWTKKRKEEIINSRISSLQTLYRAIENKQITVEHLVSVSAIGYYEASHNKMLHENDLAGNGFLSHVCEKWEEEAKKFLSLNLKVAIPRIGIVLSKEGGALREFLNPLKFGIAAIPGNGTQILSWIHIDDLCKMILFLSDNCMNDVYNAVAPYPVSTNILFDSILKNKKAMKIHLPGFVLKIVLGEMSAEILKSANVSSHKIAQEGFKFEYSHIDSAIADLLRK